MTGIFVILWVMRKRAMYRSATLLLIATSAVVSLRCTDDRSNGAAVRQPEALYFEPIGSGQSGSIPDTMEVVVRDSSEWQALAGKLRPREPFKPVDFTQFMVLLSALRQTSGGYRVEFQSVDADGREIVASYVVYSPGADCMTISALTLPFQAVAVRKTAGDVEFRRSVVRESCQVD